MRPTLAELLPLVERVAALPSPSFEQAMWLDLVAYTEAAYVRRALEGAYGGWPVSAEPAVDEAELVCRPNLDLYWGPPGRYRRRYGNLRRDDAQQVLRAALADADTATHPVLAAGGEPDDGVWFTLDPIPAVHVLAAQHGDPAGDRVHFGARSPRYVWLDRAQQRVRRSQPSA